MKVTALQTLTVRTWSLLHPENIFGELPHHPPISWKGTLGQYGPDVSTEIMKDRKFVSTITVDIHVPTLERMYHNAGKVTRRNLDIRLVVSAIYDGHSSMLPFEQDLDDVHPQRGSSVSPYLQKERIVNRFPFEKPVASPVSKL